MKIKRVILENFRGYREKTAIDFNDLTVLVGRNDVGKSTVLEALDLFFNDGKGAAKFDKGDLSVGSDAKNCTVSVVFSDLPQNVILDDSAPTSLSEEYLLNEEGDLEVVKSFNGSKCSDTRIRAFHPTKSECCDLLQKKQTDLRKMIKELEIPCEELKANPVMRKAIWEHFEKDLECKETDIAVDEADAKKIWEKLQTYLPVYALFRADRENSDGDREVQDPLKIAAEQFFKDETLQKQLSEIAENVREKLQNVANRTLEKLNEMDKGVADGLNPTIPSVDKLKWADVFKNISITGEDNIPLNKRGSGVKRLILINFFRAEAERRQQEKHTGVVYAIEEPETSQHFENQRILAKALKTLSEEPGTQVQVIVTTHSNLMVKELNNTTGMRLILDKEDGTKAVEPVTSGLLGYSSLNEINYMAFGAITEEYHDELWGYLEEHGYIKKNKKEDGEYEREQKEKGNKRDYIKEKDGKAFDPQPISLSHYIRHQIHHPENKRNKRFTREDLEQSVEEMREFIKAHRV